MGKLTGKVVIVTGASRGIGKTTAEVFAAEGASVVCAARTLKEGAHFLGGSLEETVAGIKQAGGSALAVQCDIATEEACTLLVEAARKEFGPIDVLVNNAVYANFIPIKDFPLSKWMGAFAVDIHAPFLLSQKVLPDMIEKGAGAIVNISSGAAVGPGRGPYTTTNPMMRGGTMYGAVKAALERFSQGLAEEVYPHGITVATVSPSMIVPTPGTIYQKLTTGVDDANAEPPEMMARAVLLLATEPLDKVTGLVTYSQHILKEFGWIEEGKGIGVDYGGSPHSQR